MSRESVLGEIRAALPDGDDRERRRAAELRLASPPRHHLPARATRPVPERAAQFISCLKDQGTAVLELGAAAGIPAAVADFLSKAGAPPRLRTGSDPRLAGLPWEGVAGFVRLTGAADASDRAALSHAVAGVAETGTLVLVSGTENPTSLAFLPEIHFVALERSAIVGSYEEALGVVRARIGNGVMARAVNFISGASRTGDIGGRIVMGAHGPRTLCVVIYDAGA